MSFCLRILTVGALSALASSAATVQRPSLTPNYVRSVVRAASNGRLIRTVVVSPRVIPARVVEVANSSASTEAVPDGALSIPELVEATAKKYDVDPLLVHSVIQVESAYNPRAVSPKGAQGMMQLMPSTARRFGVANSFDPRENIEGGVRYLKYLQTLFPDDPRLAIAAYNAGEGAVWKYNNRIPPYRETEHYVYSVGRRYGQAIREAGIRKATIQQASAVRPPSTVAQQPAAPVYAPVRFVYDANGGIQLSTP